MFKADNFYCGFKGTKKALNDEIVNYKIRGMVLSTREIAYNSLIPPHRFLLYKSYLFGWEF